MKSSLKSLILLTILSFVLMGCSFSNENSDDNKGELKTVQTCFNDKKDCYELEVVDDDKSRAKGLMGRKSLDEDKGMLFVFQESGLYSFWMKDTHIPLDILWISDQNTVVDLRSNVLPCEKTPCPNYNPSEKALYAIELAAGQIEEKDFKIGDSVNLGLK